MKSESKHYYVVHFEGLDNIEGVFYKIYCGFPVHAFDSDEAIKMAEKKYIREGHALFHTINVEDRGIELNHK